MLSGYGRVFGEKVGKGINDGVEEVGVEEGAGSRSVVSVEDTKDGPGVCWSSEGELLVERLVMVGGGRELCRPGNDDRVEARYA